MDWLSKCAAVAGVIVMILGLAGESTMLALTGALMACASLIGLQILEEDEDDEHD